MSNRFQITFTGTVPNSIYTFKSLSNDPISIYTERILTGIALLNNGMCALSIGAIPVKIRSVQIEKGLF